MDSAVKATGVLTVEERAVVMALSDAVRARRRRVSRNALAEILVGLGYPEDWSADLERATFARGRVWRSTPVPPARDHGLRD